MGVVVPIASLSPVIPRPDLDLDGQFITLAFAVIKQAVFDATHNCHRASALEYLYGDGLHLGEMLGLEPSVLRSFVCRVSLSPSEVATLKPPPSICVQPLFDWQQPCYLCDTSGFRKPYHTWLHWKAKHKDDLIDYAKDVLRWIGKDHLKHDRIEVLSIASKIEIDDFRTWIIRAERFNRDIEVNGRQLSFSVGW